MYTCMRHSVLGFTAWSILDCWSVEAPQLKGMVIVQMCCVIGKGFQICLHNVMFVNRYCSFRLCNHRSLQYVNVLANEHFLLWVRSSKYIFLWMVSYFNMKSYSVIKNALCYLKKGAEFNNIIAIYITYCEALPTMLMLLTIESLICRSRNMPQLGQIS